MRSQSSLSRKQNKLLQQQTICLTGHDHIEIISDDYLQSYANDIKR